MKKIAIKLEYKDKTFISEYDNYSEEEEAALIDLLEKAAKGELSCLKFKSGNIHHFFSSHVLSESILGIVYSD